MGKVLAASFSLYVTHLSNFMPYILFYGLFSSFGVMARLVGVPKDSVYSIAFDLIGMLLSMWVAVAMLLRANGILKGDESEDHILQELTTAMWSAPTYILVSMVHGFLFLIGLVLLVLPGFYFFFAFYFAPLVAIIDEDKSSFKYSRELFHARTGFVIKGVLVIGLMSLFFVLQSVFMRELGQEWIELLLNILGSFISLFVQLLTLCTYKELQGKWSELNI
jgi:hypothetical protein